MSVNLHSIHDYSDSTGYNTMTVLFDNQKVLDSKSDKLTAMMRKFTTQSNNQDKLFKHKIYLGKRIDERMTN